MKKKGRDLLGFICLFLAAGTTVPPSLAAPSRFIVVFPAGQEDALREQGLAVWTRSEDILVGEASDEDLSAVARKGISAMLRVPDTGQWMYLLHHPEGVLAPAAHDGIVVPLTDTMDFYLFPGDRKVELPRIKPRGGFMGVPRIPLAPVSPHPADLASAPERAEAVNPLVTQIVAGTSQANWYQYVNDLSGENSVMVGGISRLIRTRWSDAMFPTPMANAYASEYLLEKGAGWGYQGVRESYTNGQSGCGQQSITWQNLVFTLPGQVDYGQHQQVIFVTHYDSESYSTAENFNYSPGADDAISGGSALIEALRLFKDYAFRNTVKIIFFSGEENGLCGSLAYTRQHPLGDMWRVINMDQTAYDGDLNRFMDCYNWSITSSPQSVALGDSFVQANSDYGPIVDPAKIQRPTNHMCQTDHCPFWDAGVAAIALTEDLAHNDINPCFDIFQSATCHDTVTQVDPNHAPRLLFDQAFSWPTEKAAIALVASLADPLYLCPAGAPTLSVAPGNHTLSLSWDAAAGVTNYVIERGSSCAGPFAPIASVGSTSYDDTGLTNGSTYAYQVRTCPMQVSACVTGTPNGPSVIYRGGSAKVIADSGDHDLVPDNCELVTVQLDLQNDGNEDLTGVKLGAVTSTHPGVEVVTAIPESVGDLAIGASKPASFKFYLGRNGNSAACGATLPFTATAISDQSPATDRSFSFTAEKDLLTGTLTYPFDTDFSGWTVTSGSFSRVSGGAPGSASFSLHSRNANSICDAVVSPVITPTASSTMTMWVNFSIEGNGTGGPNRFDRAVVRAIDPATGVKTYLVPTSGVAYNTTGSVNALCDGIGNLQGWSGDQLAWAQTTFNLGALAGLPIQIEVRFSTDGSALGTEGFWFDLVQITNASQSVCDAQSNACAPLPAEVSPTGSPTPLTVGKTGPDYELTFSEVPGATAYNVYVGTLPSLGAGAYDHGTSAGLCGLTDTPGDGKVTATAAGGTLPDSAYFLAVAVNGAGESVYGTSSTGNVPMALVTCP